VVTGLSAYDSLWFGSPNWSKGRIFKATFHFPDAPQQRPRPRKPSVPHRNPVLVAREWKLALENGTFSCAADLARCLGVSRARVSQVLRLLKLCPIVLELIVSQGDPLSSPMVTERMLRPLVDLPAESQQKKLRILLDKRRNFPA